MNDLAVTSQFPRLAFAAGRETSPSSTPGAGLRLNGHAVIFTLATVLALATASECHSITYPPSLMYGAVLWGWWGCVTSAMWKLSQRVPLASSFSPKRFQLMYWRGRLLA
jgi:hypothetical protein